MARGWTGGQYSLLRAAFGLSLAIAAVSHDGPIAWRVATAIAAVLFALGVFAHYATLAVFIGWIILFRPQVVAHPWTFTVPMALALHGVIAAQQPAPYGSWAARGRVDPGGGWRISETHRLVAWIGVLVMGAGSEMVGDEAAARLPMARLAAGIAGLFRQLRPFAWLVLTGEELATLFDGEPASRVAARVLALGILFEPPWIAARAGEVETVFYDGTCGLCHRVVRFLLAEDPDGSRFRFAPLGGATFDAQVPAPARAGLPDSVLVRTTSKELLVRSDAVLHLLERLGGVWRILGLLGRIVPRPLRDVAYDGLARVRKRLFRAPAEACPLRPAKLATRFEL